MVGGVVVGYIWANGVVIEPSAYKCGVAADGNGNPELVVCLCVAGEKFCLLNPSESREDEDIGGTCVNTCMVVFPCPADNVLVVDVNSMSELVAYRGVFGGEFCRVCPNASAPHEEVRGTCINSDGIVSGGTNNGGIAADGG